MMANINMIRCSVSSLSGHLSIGKTIMVLCVLSFPNPLQNEQVVTETCSDVKQYILNEEARDSI